jgi:MYXO-CTERM domain-containing protein
MLLLVPLSFAFESEPADVLLQDEAELFTNVEYSTGVLPSGSPVGVQFRIAANGGAAVEMEGEGALWWPEALTVGFTGEPGSGIYLLDASLGAVAEIIVDFSDYGYEGTFEIDRRDIFMDGATFFDPFVMGGADQDRVEVIDEGAGTELINYSYPLFEIIQINFTADMTPTFTAGFQGITWSVNEGVISAEGAPAALTPERAADFVVDGVFTGQWDARFDLVFTPTISVYAPFVGEIEIASFDIPVEIASDEFYQDFPAQSYTFPLPLIDPGLDAGDFGDVQPGSLSNLEVPIGNVGNLAVYGDAAIEGNGEFSVYPTQFNALPGTTDGLVVTFAPTVDGPQTANLVLTSNDPSYPTLTIPLSGNGVSPDTDNLPDDVSGDDDNVKSEEIGGCGCRTDGGTPTALAALAAAALLAKRRRRA